MTDEDVGRREKGGREVKLRRKGKQRGRKGKEKGERVGGERRKTIRQ